MSFYMIFLENRNEQFSSLVNKTKTHHDYLNTLLNITIIELCTFQNYFIKEELNGKAPL